MLRGLIWVLLLLFAFSSVSLGADKIRVLVVPFEMHTQSDGENLREQISQLLKKRLADEGIMVELYLPDTEGMEALKTYGVDQYGDLGKSLLMDFVVWGSFTRIGKQYSFDARVLEVYSDTPPQILYSEGSGAEGLVDSVATLARDMALHVLKEERIADVVVDGSKRIESEAVQRVLKTKSGGLFSAKDIRDDVKAIYKMGYFGDVRVDVSEKAEGKVVTFSVKEKETVRHVQFRGNRALDSEKMEEVVGTRSGAILNVNTLQRDLAEIKRIYQEEGYHNVSVYYEVKATEKDHANVVFVIEEGERVYVRTIHFEGNVAFDDDDLRDLIKTKEKGFFSWITSSGDLDREVLEQDVSRISAHYYNNGYIQARVGAPELEYDKDSITITVKIDEGPQFKIGTVALEGDLIDTEEVLLAKVKTATGAVYNRETVREDILALSDLYSDQGYAYADISPRVDQHEETHLADITYVIDKKNLVYFEKIIIGGNTKTRDKVIRRELRVYEQELFSGKRLKRGTRNLYRLDYFEDIKVDASPGSSEDKMVLKIDVSEKPTGSFSFGGGYSTVDKLFAMATIKQRNLFGKGQILSLAAQLGSRTTNYTLGFTEPWLFDIPLAAGFELYNNNKDYDTYDRDSFGGTVRVSYPVYEYTRASLSYNYDRSEIENLTTDASSSIREWQGTNIGHTFTMGLRRDTRDKVFNTTEGSNNGLTIEHAGVPFGGDYGYTKYIASSGWYFPLFWKAIGFVNGRMGFIHGDSQGRVPTWERFYMGGMNTIRGYDWREISPVDPDTGDKIGGNKLVQCNLEFLFPLVEKSGLRGVLFYDTGDVYDNGEEISISSFRESTGFGIRWYSPVGPIRLEYGYVLDSERRGEGGWEFAMGGAF